MSMYLFIFGMLAVFAAFCWFYTRGDALTGRAVVISRRVGVAKYVARSTSGNGWNYLVTFRFSDGDELELYVSPEEYKQLEEGTSGTLVWHRDVLSYFEPDMEVTT